MEESVSSYFANTKVEAFLTEMLTELGRGRPDDPMSFMSEFIGSRIRRPSVSSRSRPSKVSSSVEHFQDQLRRLDHEASQSDFDSTILTPEGSCSDPSTIVARNRVLEHVARQLRNEDKSIHAFIREWVDHPDRLQTLPQPCTVSSARPSRRMSGSLAARLDSEYSALFEKEEASLEALVSWDFDTLSAPDAVLVCNTFQVFQLWGFLGSSTCSPVDRRKLQSFISAIYAGYESSNPYHNFKHAYSVFSGTASILRSGLSEMLTLSAPEELGLLIGALTHDVGHPGFNNDFLVKTRHKLATRYNDSAVLENMHCSLAFECLFSHNFLSEWSDADYQTFRKTVILSVINTDMKVHFDLVSKLQEISEIPDVRCTPEARKALLSVVVHAADLSNPLLPTEHCQKWAGRVVEEFHRQALREAQLGLEPASFMKTPPTDESGVASLQVSFINYVVAPMWRCLGDLLPDLADRVDQLDKNLSFWMTRIRPVETAFKDDDNWPLESPKIVENEAAAIAQSVRTDAEDTVGLSL